MSTATGHHAMDSARLGDTSMYSGVPFNDAKDVDSEGPMSSTTEHSGQDPSTTVAGTGAGPNPLAQPFAPSEDGNWQGVRSPHDFMAHFRAMQAAKGPTTTTTIRITAPHRRILFKNVPEWMTLSDLLCLVYGGPVDRAWKADENTFIVQFCDDDACKMYYDNNSAGIRVGDESESIIDIDKPEGTERVSTELQKKLADGISRLVRVTGVPLSKSFQDLRDAVASYDVDHILWRDAVNQPGVGYVFFANLTHAWDFKQKVQADFSWENCQVDYLPDPCQVATGFHCNTIPCAMSSAAVHTPKSD